MKKSFIALLIFLVSIPAFSSQRDDIQKAGDAYSQKDYGKAAELYEKVIKDYGESAEVYYNIGNCYYKLNKLAPAILNYERSLLLEPGNGDARFNLEIAKLKTVDKIENLGDFFLFSWLNDVQNLYSTNKWCYIGITCFVLLICSLILYFFSRKILLRKIGFYAGIVLICFTLASNIFAYRQKVKLIERKTAVIMVKTTTIKSSPDDSGTGLFILHEGVKLRIQRSLNDWTEIRTADGNVGWIRTNEIEVI